MGSAHFLINSSLSHNSEAKKRSQIRLPYIYSTLSLFDKANQQSLIRKKTHISFWNTRVLCITSMEQQQFENTDEELPRAVPVPIERSSSPRSSTRDSRRSSRSRSERANSNTERNDDSTVIDVIFGSAGEEHGETLPPNDCESSDPQQRQRVEKQEVPKIDEPTSACRYCLETSLCAFVNVVVIMSVWAWVEPVKRLHGIGY